MTLDGILKSFNKTLGKLDKLMARNQAEIDANNESVSRLKARNDELEFEIVRAQDARENIARLIGA